MDFYDEFEDDISNGFIVTDMKTSDMKVNNNETTGYILSTLDAFFSKKNVSKELMSTFNFQINQMVVWENIILYNDPFSRKTFNADDFTSSYDYAVPDYYEILDENNSVVSACIKYFKEYLNKKYTNFDFGVVDTIAERQQNFTSFNYLYKLFYMFETLLPIAIKNIVEDYATLFDDLKDHERINKLKTKTYLGLIWNTTLTKYLSRCDQDLFEVFENQSWDFVSEYVLKNI